MSAPLRLVLFDVDGTLVDSQGSIVAAMTASFGVLSLSVPDREAILSIVGLSLPNAMAHLASEHPDSGATPLGRGLQGGLSRASVGAGRGQVHRSIRVRATPSKPCTRCPRFCWAWPPVNRSAGWMR